MSLPVKPFLKRKNKKKNAKQTKILFLKNIDMDSLPTLSNLQGALLNDEENEEELLSIMTHLLVCAIEDPGIPNPARHITLLGQSLKQADITHTNISEILRIYLYANATGEVKALTGEIYLFTYRFSERACVSANVRACVFECRY